MENKAQVVSELRHRIDDKTSGGLDALSQEFLISKHANGNRINATVSKNMSNVAAKVKQSAENTVRQKKKGASGK